jgi:glycosyltransferase involved in cell wall biosynthesis
MEIVNLHILADGAAGGGLFSALRMMGANRNISHPILVSQERSFAAECCVKEGFEFCGVNFAVPRTNRAAARAINRVFSDRKPTFVFIHGGISLHLAQLAITSNPNVAVAYAPHGYRFPSRNFVVRTLKPFIERRLCRSIDALLFVAEYEKVVAQQFGLIKDSVFQRVAYNPIDPSEIPPAHKTDMKLIGCLGRHVAQKNPFFVLKVAHLLKDQGYRFRMVGGGPLEQAVRRDIDSGGLRGIVEVTGELNRPNALEAMRDVGAAILPSIWEGLPRVAPELLLMGVPIVASAVSGTPEIVKDGITGSAIKGFRAEEYANALKRLLTDIPFRQRIINTGRQTVLEMFSEAKSILVYRELATMLREVHKTRVNSSENAQVA